MLCSSPLPPVQEVADVQLRLLGRDKQSGATDGELTGIGEAVGSGLVNNETLGYYMARTQLFLVASGIDPQRLRFRQHLSTEMAHYAADCWDAEVFGSYGWIEVVGHADRSAFDLKVHSERSKVELMAQEKLDEPQLVEQAAVRPNFALLGRTFGSRPDYKELVRHSAASAALSIRTAALSIRLCAALTAGKVSQDAGEEGGAGSAGELEAGVRLTAPMSSD
jgi:glycyl-tRNA synthetase (class II)